MTGDLARARTLLGADPGLARSVDERGRSAFVLAHLRDRPEVAWRAAATA